MQIEFLTFIKYFSLVQLCLIVISVFGIYTAKIIRSTLESNNKKWTQYFTQQFQQFNFFEKSSFNIKKLKKTYSANYSYHKANRRIYLT